MLKRKPGTPTKQLSARCKHSNSVTAVHVNTVMLPVVDVCLQHVASGFLVGGLAVDVVLSEYTFRLGRAMTTVIAFMSLSIIRCWIVDTWPASQAYQHHMI